MMTTSRSRSSTSRLSTFRVATTPSWVVCLTKLMARPCYVYLKLKMPGPNRVIMISGNPKRSNECDDANAAITETLIAIEELVEIQKEADAEQLPSSKKRTIESSFQSAKDTKKVRVHPEDSFKTV